MTSASRVCSRSLTSCTLARLTTIDSGTPLPSTRRLRFRPFSPDPLDFFQQTQWRAVSYTPNRRCFATPRQSLPAPRIQPALSSKSKEKNQQKTHPGIVCESHWHSHNIEAALSIGSPFVKRTRWLQIPVAQATAFFPLQPFSDRFDPSLICESEPMALSYSIIRQKPSKI